MNDRPLTLASDILVNAMIYLSDRRRWCQGRAFIKETGQSCLTGTIHHVAYRGVFFVEPNKATEDAKDMAFRLLMECAGTKDLERWNDTHSYEQVRMLLDRACAKAQVMRC